jgi:hypothetical protein
VIIRLIIAAASGKGRGALAAGVGATASVCELEFAHALNSKQTMIGARGKYLINFVSCYL